MAKKDSSQSQSPSPILVGLLVLSLIVTIVGAGYLILTTPNGGQAPVIQVGGGDKSAQPGDSTSGTQPAQAPTDIISPEDLPPVPTGSQTYNISGQTSGPKITSATIDPLDAAAGQTQTVTIQTQYDAGVSEVNATFILNGKEYPVTLSQTSEEDTVSTWTGSWQLEGEYTQSYGLTIGATGSDGVASSPQVELFFR